MQGQAQKYYPTQGGWRFLETGEANPCQLTQPYLYLCYYVLVYLTNSNDIMCSAIFLFFYGVNMTQGILLNRVRKCKGSNERNGAIVGRNGTAKANT